METVEWRSIPGFARYEVSNFGWVRRAKRLGNWAAGGVLGGSIDPNGYVAFILIDDAGARRLTHGHTLTAKAFIGPRPTPRHHAAHWDGRPFSNYLSNIRWATPKENKADSIRHGTDACGARNGMAKMTDEQVASIRRELVIPIGKKRVPKGRLAAVVARTGLSISTIERAAKGWTYKEKSQ